MAISQELSDKILAAYREFVATANKNGVRYVSNQENFDRLKKRALKEVTAESLALPAVWASTWLQASAEGLIEEPAPPKTQAEIDAAKMARIQRLQEQDRRAGLNPHKSDAELEQERLDRIDAHNKGIDDQAAAKEAAKLAKEQAARAELAKGDLSCVPTIAVLKAAPFSQAEEAAWCRKHSSQQIKKYIQNKAEADRQNLFEANEALRLRKNA
jgi:hypothetical protein